MRTFLFWLSWLMAFALFLYIFGPTPAPLATIIQNFKSGWVGLAAGFGGLIVASFVLYFMENHEAKSEKNKFNAALKTLKEHGLEPRIYELLLSQYKEEELALALEYFTSRGYFIVSEKGALVGDVTNSPKEPKKVNSKLI